VTVLQVILATAHLAPPLRARSNTPQQDLHNPVLLQSLWQRAKTFTGARSVTTTVKGNGPFTFTLNSDCCGWTEENRYGQESWRQYLGVRCAPLGDGVLEETIRLPHRAGAHP
jgi:hypothetical protein